MLSPKPTGALEYCHEGETSCWFSNFLVFILLTLSLRRQRTSMYVPLFTATIAVNYAAEFQQIFEAATCMFVC